MKTNIILLVVSIICANLNTLCSQNEGILQKIVTDYHLYKSHYDNCSLKRFKYLLKKDIEQQVCFHDSRELKKIKFDFYGIPIFKIKEKISNQTKFEDLLNALMLDKSGSGQTQGIALVDNEVKGRLDKITNYGRNNFVYAYVLCEKNEAIDKDVFTSHEKAWKLIQDFKPDLFFEIDNTRLGWLMIKDKKVYFVTLWNDPVYQPVSFEDFEKSFKANGGKDWHSLINFSELKAR